MEFKKIFFYGISFYIFMTFVIPLYQWQLFKRIKNLYNFYYQTQKLMLIHSQFKSMNFLFNLKNKKFNTIQNLNLNEVQIITI